MSTETYNQLDEIHDMVGSLMFTLDDTDQLYWELTDMRDALEELMYNIEDQIGEDDDA